MTQQGTVIAVDREALRKFLTANAKVPDMVPGAMEMMELFFSIGKRYELMEGSEQLANHIEEALELVIGEQVDRIEFISKGHPFPRSGWMSREGYEKSRLVNLWPVVGDSLRTSLHSILWYSLGESVRKAVEYRDLHIVQNFLSDFWRKGRTSRSFWHQQALMRSRETSLFYYLAFTLAGDKEAVAKLTPLIELLPYAIPLGEKKDEPGTWLVLAA